MTKLTKQQFNSIVAAVQEDIADYIAKTKQVFCEEGFVEELQYDDICYVYAALTNFILTRDVQQLISALMQQDTYVREQFLSALSYCEDELIDVYV